MTLWDGQSHTRSVSPRVAFRRRINRDLLISFVACALISRLHGVERKLEILPVCLPDCWMTSDLLKMDVSFDSDVSPWKNTVDGIGELDDGLFLT